MLYADDVGLYAESCADMQALLDVLQCFCVLFKLKVNIRKTKGMVFHPRPASYVKRCVWYYGGECIEMVDRFTYLGVIFHQSEGCLYGVDALVAQGSKAMYAAWAKLRALGITQVDMMCRVFDALVFPVVSYGCQIWGPDVFHNKFDSSHIISRAKNIIRGCTHRLYEVSGWIAQFQSTLDSL